MATLSFEQSGLPKDLYDALLTIVEKYNGEEDTSTQVVVMKDQILGACMLHKFCKPRKFHAKELSPHPSNRDGEGLSANRAQTRMKVIKKGGCSLNTLRPNCVAIEDDPDTRHVAKFGCDVIASSQKFAKLQYHEIKAGTLGAGHATHGFAMLHDEVPCDIPEISENGRMSKQKCFADKTIKDIVENGLEFDVLDYRVERAFKVVPHIIQSALNVVQQVSEGESWHQMLLKVLGAAKEQSPRYDWKAIKKLVLRTQPPRPQDVPDMVEWVAKWGGLPSGVHVKDLSEVCSANVPSDRVVPGSLFKSMVDLKCPANFMPAELMTAFVYVCANANVCISDGVSRYIKGADITAIFTTKDSDLLARATLANTILQRSRIMFDANPTFPKHRRLTMTCQLKEACVEATLARKGSPEERDLATIAADFVKDFEASVSGAPTKLPAAQCSDAKSNNAVEYDDTGAANIGGMLVAQANFEVLKFVRRKEDKDLWNLFQISNIDERDGTVELKHVCKVNGTVIHDSLTTVDRVTFLSTYSTTEKEITVLETYPIGDPNGRAPMMHDLWYRGVIANALTDLHARHSAPKLRIYKSPQHVVKALQEFAVGGIVLVPITPNIRELKDENTNDVHVLCTVPNMKSTKYGLTKFETKDFVNVFWHVLLNVVHDVDKANCAFELRDAKSKGVHFGARNSNTETVYSIPCIVNTKAIIKDEILTLYRDKPVEKATGVKREANFTFNAGYVKKAK